MLLIPNVFFFLFLLYFFVILYFSMLLPFPLFCLFLFYFKLAEYWFSNQKLPLGNPQLHGILIGETSPKGLDLSTKTWLHSKASKPQCWRPQNKNQAKQDHNPTH